MNFVKMEGLGNDFIILDFIDKPLEFSENELHVLARKLCDRHRGIGADGLLLLLSSDKAIIRMRIFNPDGSEAEMCGNGIRCLARYAFERKIAGRQFDVETGAGNKHVQIFSSTDEDVEVEVNMGVYKFLSIDYRLPSQIPAISVNTISMGNPHCAIFLENIKDVPVEEWGRCIEKDPAFSGGINVEFCQVIGNDKIRVVVWERGAGRTLACGTGACAAFAAASAKNMTGKSAEVVLDGGSLFIRQDEDGSILMRGPAREVFTGVIRL